MSALVIDTSALLAILKTEAEARELLRCLSQPEHKLIGSATLLEAQIVVLSHLGAAGLPELDVLVSQAEILPIPFERLQLHWALQGWRRYDQGIDSSRTDMAAAWSLE